MYTCIVLHSTLHIREYLIDAERARHFNFTPQRQISGSGALVDLRKSNVCCELTGEQAKIHKIVCVIPGTEIFKRCNREALTLSWHTIQPSI